MNVRAQYYTPLLSAALPYVYDHYRGQHTILSTSPFQLHVHDCNEILIVREGVFYNYFDDEMTAYEGPHIIFNKEGQAHLTVGPAETVYDRYNIRYQKLQLKSADILSSMNSFVCPIENKENELFTYAALLGHESMNYSDSPEAIQLKDCLLTALLLKVYEAAQIYFSDNTKKNMLYIRSVCNYIDKRYRSKLSIEKITDEFFVSKSKLCRDFKEYTGTTIVGYITQRRIEYAKGLLLSGESVQNTAAMAGFEYESNFINVFRRACGVTPLAFKRNMNS